MRRAWSAATVVVVALALAGCGDDEDAEAGRTAITLQTEDDDKSWVDGRVVVSWHYPVNREAAQAVAVDDCVGQLN